MHPRPRAFTIVVAVAALAGTWTRAAEGTSEAELRSLELRRSAAIAAHQTDFLQAIYADDFHGVTATGYEVDKARLLEVFARGDGGIVFTLKVETVRVLDNSAVVTGRLSGTDTGGNLVHDSKYVHVYHHRSGHWQIVFGQGTMLPQTANQPGRADALPAANRHATEAELRILEQEWDDALVAKDRDALERIVADDFMLITADGQVASKDQLLDGVMSPDVRMDPFTTEDVNVRLYGDVAVLTGRFIQTGSFRGQPFTSHILYTDVYRRTNGRWQAVSAQATAIPPPA